MLTMENFARKLNRIEFYCFVFHFIPFHSMFCAILLYLNLSHWNWTWHTKNGVIEIACNVSRFVFISTRILHFRGSIRLWVCMCGMWVSLWIGSSLFYVFTIVLCDSNRPYHEWQSSFMCMESYTQNNRLKWEWWRIDSFVTKQNTHTLTQISSHIECERNVVSHVWVCV